MTHPLLLLNAVVCAAICLRLIFFRRAGGAHRPIASAIAYLLIVASGLIPLRTVLGLTIQVSYSQFVLNLALCVAVFAMRGNVVELFRRSDDITDNPITRWLRKEKWL